jgi:hypothetical protein
MAFRRRRPLSWFVRRRGAKAMNEVPQPARRSILVRLTALVVVFAIGLACGIGLDRHWLRPVPPAKTESPSVRQRLVGMWLADNGAKTEFKADGTFEDTFRETGPDIKPGEVIDDPTKVRVVERERRVTGQYQWVDDDKIEVKILREPTRRLKIVVDGDGLTVLHEDGKVVRLKRSK